MRFLERAPKSAVFRKNGEESPRGAGRRGPGLPFPPQPMRCQPGCRRPAWDSCLVAAVSVEDGELPPLLPPKKNAQLNFRALRGRAEVVLRALGGRESSRN